jgi:hypothetical protein
MDTGNYTDENWEAELAEATSKLGIKQKRALRAYYNYHKKMEVVMRKFLAGDIKNIENALLLLDCYLTDVLQKTVHTPGAMDGLAINYEQICGLQNYYINIIKNAAKRLDFPDTQAPEADAETLKKEAAEIDKTLNLLCKNGQKVRYSREKNQAIINCKLPDLQDELRYLVAAKKVTIPAATDIDSINEFIRKNIRAKNGKSTGNLMRVQKSREKLRTNTDKK